MGLVMDFDKLLDRLWGFDAEIFAHDSLFVFINYRTREEKVFHNSAADELINWIVQNDPILMGYNAKSYDKYILQGWMGGCTPEELKEVNDYIIGGGNGWDLQLPYCEVKVPIIWDLMGGLKTIKSLKELEGNLRLDITETTIPFDLPTKWTDEQYKEVLYYCRHDVEALFPIFEMMLKKYKAKYIISQLGGIEPSYALSQTDANLTAILLGGKKKEHKDNFAYTYPDVIDKSKIPQEVLDYIDDLIEHNDLDYKPKAPTLRIDDCVIQLGVGGIHGAKENTFIYDEGVDFHCE